MTAREQLAKSWEAAARRATVTGGVQLNEASCAGQLLALADGDVDAAESMIPADVEAIGFWRRVREYLVAVRKEQT